MNQCRVRVRIIPTVSKAIIALLLLKCTISGIKAMDAINPDRLKSHVHTFSSKIGDRNIYNYDNLNESADYIVEQFRSYGYVVQFQEYAVENKKVKNIIVEKRGLTLPEEVIIVGAHYDTCFNPGADDNASGVAGLLELARLLSKVMTNRTIKFIAFVNEEPPFFKTGQMGSLVYVRQAKAKKKKIKGALILESIGYYSDKPFSQQYPPLLGFFYPNKGNFIGVVGNFNSRHLLRKVVKSFQKATQFPIESLVALVPIAGVDFSDHWSFWKEGYPAVMVTDTALFRNPHYHQDSDTYEKLNYAHMVELVKGLQAVLTEIAR